MTRATSATIPPLDDFARWFRRTGGRDAGRRPHRSRPRRWLTRRFGPSPTIRESTEEQGEGFSPDAQRGAPSASSHPRTTCS